MHIVKHSVASIRLKPANAQVNRRPPAGAREKHAAHAGVRLNAMLGRDCPVRDARALMEYKLPATVALPP